MAAERFRVVRIIAMRRRTRDESRALTKLLRGGVRCVLRLNTRVEFARDTNSALKS
jgi:hypothetical protein